MDAVLGPADSESRLGYDRGLALSVSSCAEGVCGQGRGGFLSHHPSRPRPLHYFYPAFLNPASLKVCPDDFRFSTILQHFNILATVQVKYGRGSEVPGPRSCSHSPASRTCQW